MSHVKILSAVVIGFTAMAASAQATDWNKRIDMCVEALQAETSIDLSAYSVEFDGGSDRRFEIVFSPADGGDKLYAECRVARDRIKTAALKSN